MSKLKIFEVYKSGSVKIKEIKATSVTLIKTMLQLDMQTPAEFIMIL